MGTRWNSSATILGHPLISVAIGADTTKNELRGHARGIIAYGDIATGVVACGGFARGVIALGGLTMGLIAVGGCGIGIFSIAGLARSEERRVGKEC